MRIAIVVTSVRSIDATWTTTHLAHAALAAGHMLRIIEAHDFEITSTGRMVARAWCLDRPIVHVDETGRTISQRAMERRYVELTACDMILLRVNPLPWHILQLATMASAEGVPVINDPAGICVTRGKAWLASLTDVPTPPTLVTSTRDLFNNLRNNIRENWSSSLPREAEAEVCNLSTPGAPAHCSADSRLPVLPVVPSLYRRISHRREMAKSVSCGPVVSSWAAICVRVRPETFDTTSSRGGGHTLPRLRSRTKLWLASSARTS